MTFRRTDTSNGVDQWIDLHLPAHVAATILHTAGWNHRVLQAGSVDGQISRGLVGQNCLVTIVQADAQAALRRDLGAEEDFDVVLVGNALARSSDPQACLDRLVPLMATGGRLILVAPNLAHADVRLALAQGTFDFSSNGVHKEHVPLFTLGGLTGMIERAGLAIVDLLRVRVPAFETSLGIDRLSVPTGTLDALLAEPEAETHLFVLTAVRETAEHRIGDLFARFEQARIEIERHVISATRQAIEIDALNRQLHGLRDEHQRQQAASVEASRQLESLAAETQSLRSTLSRLTDELRTSEEDRARQAEDALTETQSLRSTLSRLTGELRTSEDRARQAEDALTIERQIRTAADDALAALQGTRTFRYTRLPRAVYAFFLRKRGS